MNSDVFKKSNNDPARDDIIKHILITLEKNGNPVDLSTEASPTLPTASPAISQGTIIPSTKHPGVGPQTGINIIPIGGHGLTGFA